MTRKKQNKANRQAASRAKRARTNAPARSRRAPNVLVNVAVLCSVTFALLLVAELTFRYIYDPDLKLSTEQIWEAQEYGTPTDDSMYTEFAGIRFREEQIPDDILEDKWTRVLFLGDSFTYGSGIDNNENRFSDIVERELNQELPENQRQKRVHVLNASQPGSNPSGWLETFEAVAPLYKPHHVVAVFFLRDGAPLGTSLKFNARIIEPIQQKYSRVPLYDHSALLRYFCDRFAWKEYTDKFKQILISSYVGSEEERAKWLYQQQFLLMLSNQCKRRGMSFSLVIFPMLFDLKDYQFGDVENEIIRFAEDNEIPVFSLTPGFIGEEDSELWVASNNQHPNDKGHRIAASTLLPFMREVCSKDERRGM